MAGIVILAALNVAPILVLAVLAVAVVLLTGCIDADEHGRRRITPTPYQFATQPQQPGQMTQDLE